MRLFTVSERGVEAGIPLTREPFPCLMVGEARVPLDKRFGSLPPGDRLQQADLIIDNGCTHLEEPRQQDDRKALVALRFVPGYRGTVKYALVRDGTEHRLSEGDGDVVILATVNVLGGESAGVGNQAYRHYLAALWPGAQVRVRLQSRVAGYDEGGIARDGVIEYRYGIRWDGKALEFVDWWEPEVRFGFAHELAKG